MFYGEFREKGNIKLIDTTADVFAHFIGCMYGTNEVTGSRLNISGLISLAHKYDVNWLENECEEILYQMIEENAAATLWVLPLAKLYGYNNLCGECTQKIHHNGYVIVKSAEFVNCEKDVLNEVLGVSFVGRKEPVLFKTCMEWAKQACQTAGLDYESPENIRKVLGDCLDLIQFETISVRQFLQCLNINPGLFLPKIQELLSKLGKDKPNNAFPQTMKSPLVMYRLMCLSVFFESCTRPICILKQYWMKLMSNISMHSYQ